MERKEKTMSERRVNAVIIAAMVLVGLLLLGVGIGITYLIGNSDLPDWVKFFLLR
jgi:hypothetical protein